MKEKRIERVLEKLGAMGLEQMVVADAISILYLTDIWVDAGERLVALYLNRNGKHCLFVNHMFTLPAEPGWRWSGSRIRILIWSCWERG